MFERRDTRSEAIVRIFGMPMAVCGSGHTWEVAAAVMAKRLSARYGPTVRTEYVEIFSAGSFDFPEILEMVSLEQALPPIITLNGKLIHSGRKLSEPVVHEELGRLGIFPIRNR